MSASFAPASDSTTPEKAKGPEAFSAPALRILFKPISNTAQPIQPVSEAARFLYRFRCLPFVSLSLISSWFAFLLLLCKFHNVQFHDCFCFLVSDIDSPGSSVQHDQLRFRLKLCVTAHWKEELNVEMGPEQKDEDKKQDA